MGRDAPFGDIVHSAGPDLDLEPPPGLGEQGAVEGLIAVCLRVFHPVPEAVRFVTVNPCHDGKYMVALVALGFL